MTRHFANDHTSIAVKNDGWQVFEEGKNGWRMVLKFAQRKMTLYIHQSNTLSVDAFKANAAAHAIEKGRSEQLKPFGKQVERYFADKALWQELYKGECPFKIEEDCIRYYAVLILNQYTNQHLYCYASLQYHASLESKVSKYLEDFFTVFNNIHFARPQSPATEAVSNTPAWVSKVPQNNINILAGNKLIRMESYDSGSYSGGGGYSIEEQIFLYADGTCYYRYTSIISGGSVGGFSLGGGFTEEKSAGSWNVAGNILGLRLNNGNTKTWEILIAGTKVWLGNHKYYLEKL